MAGERTSMVPAAPGPARAVGVAEPDLDAGRIRPAVVNRSERSRSAGESALTSPNSLPSYVRDYRAEPDRARLRRMAGAEARMWLSVGMRLPRNFT